MDYVYRMSTKDDQAALIRLWHQHSGWDQVTEEMWALRMHESPFGPARIAVMQEAESGEIVGQMAFIPSRVCVKGREVIAARPFAEILAKSVRIHAIGPGNLDDLPTAAMRRCGTDALKEEGFSLTYGLPNPNWLPLIRETHTGEYATFPMWSQPLPLNEPMSLPDGYSAGPLRAWDERVDRLWARASRLYDCMAVRDTRTLPRKSRYGYGNSVTEVEYRGELVGLVIVRGWGGPQLMINDVLTVDAGPALEATLKAACNAAHVTAMSPPAVRPPLGGPPTGTPPTGTPPTGTSPAGGASSVGAPARRWGFRKVGVLATPLALPVLQSLGFQRDDYNFLVTVQVLGSDLNKDDVAPQKWYWSDND